MPFLHDPLRALVPHTLDEPIRGGGNGPLSGLAFTVKDMFALQGRKVSNGNPGFYAIAEPAPKTAPCVQALLEAGADLTGVTVCDEFFYSLLGTNAHYGDPMNPNAPERVTGGSSCGAASSVASTMCDFALGSDTGGSIRIPAAFCGLYGLRPSYGRIDMEGVTPMAPRYDTIGILAREASVLAQVAEILLDDRRVEGEVGQILIAEDLFALCEPKIAETIRTYLAHEAGRLPPQIGQRVAGDEIEHWRDAFRVLQGRAVQETLLPLIRQHDLALGPGIRERFEMAARITADEAKAAQKMRERATGRMLALAQPGVAIALPTAPTLPPRRDEPEGEATASFRALTLQLTCPAGHAGLPQISIPVGEIDGCPIGLSLIGWQGGDEALLALAASLARR